MIDRMTYSEDDYTVAKLLCNINHTMVVPDFFPLKNQRELTLER